MGNHKAYAHNLETEHGAQIAKEAQQRADAKEAYKDGYKTYTMEMSRDDIDRLNTVVRKNPNAGKWHDFLNFINGDKGFWTEELTLKIVDHDSDYSDYDDSKTQQ